MAKRAIERADILPMDEYGAIRKDHRRRLIAVKKPRRVAVGPDVSVYFENYLTMWSQVHEMLWIERGGDAQIADELSAYNPLIPRGNELIATFMVEIDDARRRAASLAAMGGIERAVSLHLADWTIAAVADEDDGIERTKADGKTSSVHFLRFAMTPEQIAAFKDADLRAVLAIDHPAYQHMAVLGPATRAALIGDLD